MSPHQAADPGTRAASMLQRSAGALGTAAVARMDREIDWFAELGAEERSWVGLIVQAGIRGFVDWFHGDTQAPLRRGSALATSVFGAAPRALAGVISLQQTVDLVRLAIEVVESEVEELLGPEQYAAVRDRLSRYAREVAFATAEVYARAAEVRGAWDARLEALVVDAVLRAETDESVLSQASALGWAGRGGVAVVLGSVPSRRTDTDLFDQVRRAARSAGADALCAVQGERLVVLLGGVAEAGPAAQSVAGLFGPGAVVVGPLAEDLSGASSSARAAVAAHRASGGWPQAPRPVASIDLVPERVLSGDGQARRHLVEDVYLPLVRARGTLIETLTAYFHTGGSIEATARELFVHPNTVRYRLRQVRDVTELLASAPRDGFTLQIALVLGRQSGRDL